MKQSSKDRVYSNQSVASWPEYKIQDVICDCMSVKRKEIIPLVGKVSGIDDLVSCSGAGSVCTGCHPLLQELMGDKVWTPVEIVSIAQVSSVAKSFKLKSLDEPFKAADSGQHILFQVHINGSWVLRRYTLTTPAGETDYREIIVQKEPGGLVSNWLFDLTNGIEIADGVSNSAINKLTKEKIRISQPVGNIKFNLADKNPLICLVGGVGVTPAISALRSIQQSGDTKSCRKILVDYSVQSKNRVVNTDALKPSEETSDSSQVYIRITDDEGFIDQTHINEIVNANPNGEFFVCGPTAYINTVTDYLASANVPESRIKIELFTMPDTKVVKQTKRYFYLGLFLLAAFFIQDFFQMKITWLESLQSNENYKIFSGLGLLLYLIMQFVLPYNKNCEVPHATAKSYNRHKLRGVFTPLVFYIHSTQLGVAYLFLLSCVFFGNILIGLLNHEFISDPVKRVRYFRLWLPVHISLSVLLVALITFHVFIVASY